MSRSITVWYTATNVKRFYANENGKTSRISRDEYYQISAMASSVSCIHQKKHQFFKTLTI